MITWNSDVLNNTDANRYKFIGVTDPYYLSKLIKDIQLKYNDIEIHVNAQTCACTYNNNIKDACLVSNLKIICTDEEVFQAIARMYGGSFDLKRKKFWINDVDSVNIVINKSVEDGYSYIVSGDEIIGYCNHAECPGFVR